MVKKQLLLLIASLLFVWVAKAQKLTVESMKAVPMDLSASQYERKDLNGHPCALVKVQLATMGVRFEGNVVGSTDYKTNEYWVYMTDGSYMLSVKHPNFVTLSVNFRDYGINGVQGKATYCLTLLIPQAGGVVQTQKLTINYSPADAMVLVDSKSYKGNGRVEVVLPIGNHNYIIAAEGYESAEGSVKLTATAPRIVTEHLLSLAQQPAVQQTVSPVAQPTVVQMPATPAPSQPSTATASGAAVETITVNGVSFNMVCVEGGTFTMGATSEQGRDAYSDEEPAHQVTLSTYSIGETEVTQDLWQAVMGSNPSRFKGNNKPVERVSWEDCQTFISKLNQLTGRRFRLPTEAEWEYAARGGSKSRGNKYSGSNNLDDVAWYWENSGDQRLSGNWDSDKITQNNCRTHDVKTKQANELGLYDMSGNVWEWCQDWKANYSSDSQTNPAGPSSGSFRVLRGGSWYYNARLCRVSGRRISPGITSSNLGLRLAL